MLLPDEGLHYTFWPFFMINVLQETRFDINIVETLRRIHRSTVIRCVSSIAKFAKSHRRGPKWDTC
jgi:hypothetical protein